MLRAKRSYDGRALSVAVAISATLLAPPPPVFADNLDAMEERLGLADLVRQALKVNLDLAAQRDALEANREQVGIARSSLLPQVNVSANAQYLEDDRSDDGRGTVSQRSATVAAGATQLLYDENAWAGYRIQEHVYAGQRSDFESFRLGLIERAALVFLDLDRSRAVVDIQKKNREITLENLETTRARIATGYSSEREILRWQSQLAGNDQAVTNASAQAMIDVFELNAIRNRPLETPVVAISANETNDGFMYNRSEIAAAIGSRESARKFRDSVVAFGLARSPILVAINESIQAEKRRLTANKRSFWVPSVTLGADVNHLAAEDAKDSDADFDDTEWKVGVGLTLPIFAGGARLAELRQTTQQLSSFQVQYDANALSISQGIRSALARSSAGFANIASARAQVEAAQKNFDLVNSSYVSGVASILGLLDAQTQLLRAQLALKNAQFDFLAALISVEQQIAFYPFLEPKAEVERFLDDLVAGLRS